MITTTFTVILKSCPEYSKTRYFTKSSIQRLWSIFFTKYIGHKGCRMSSFMTVDLYKEGWFLKASWRGERSGQTEDSRGGGFLQGVCYYACTCRSSVGRVVLFAIRHPKSCLKKMMEKQTSTWSVFCVMFLWLPEAMNGKGREQRLGALCNFLRSSGGVTWGGQPTALVGDCQRPRGGVTFLAVRFWGVHGEKVKKIGKGECQQSHSCVLIICLFV